MNRIELIDLMMRYGGLDGSAARTIRHFNRIRNAIQHDNQVYRGSRQAVEQYARLAQSIIRGPEHVLAAAAYPDDLFAATTAALDRPASPKPQAPPGGAPSAARPLPADAPSRPPAAAAPRPAVPSSRDTLPVRDARGQRGGAQNSTLLIIVLIVALAVLLSATLPRGPSQPLQPTPTLGLPASRIHPWPLRNAVEQIEQAI